MSDVFAERLRAGGIERNAEEAAAWLRALSVFVDSGLAVSDLPDLVRLAFQRTSQSDLGERLRVACNEAGGREIKPSDVFLLTLLACQGVIEVFDRLAEDEPVQTALLVRTALFNGWQPGHPDVVDEAHATVRSAANRLAAPEAPPRAPGRRAATKEALDALTTADWSVYRTAIVQLNTEIQHLRNYGTRLSNHIAQSQVPIREQTELLWWITSSFSLTANRALRDLPIAAAPCVIALDLARITNRPPGPIAIDSFLGHALRQTDGAHDGDATVATTAAATRKLGLDSEYPAPPQRIADFTPILTELAAEGSAQVEGHEPNNLVLARQAYDELLLATYEF